MKSVVTSLLPKETPLDLMIEHGEILKEASEVLEELTCAYFERKEHHRKCRIHHRERERGGCH